jgi:hypothetical protein
MRGDSPRRAGAGLQARGTPRHPGAREHLVLDPGVEENREPGEVELVRRIDAVQHSPHEGELVLGFG